MELLFGFMGYLILGRYLSFSKYYYNTILIMLLIFSVWGLIIDFFCTYKMVKPIKVTFRTIVLFIFSLKIIEFFVSFLKLLLPLVVGSCFLVACNQGSKFLENIFTFILIFLMSAILALIKIVIAQSYFTSLSPNRVIAWMLIASFLGFFVPHYMGSFYMRYLLEKDSHQMMNQNNN